MYSLVGGLTNEYWKEFSSFNNALNLFVKDLEIDVAQLKRDFDRVDELKKLDFNRLWIGNSENEPEQKVSIGIINTPQLGAALFPEPTGLAPDIPIPNPTFNPISGLDWLLSGAWLPQIYAGSTGLIDPTPKETKFSSSLAMTQIKAAQAIKRLDYGAFIVKNKTLNFVWENPAMLAIPEEIKSFYDLETSYTFTQAQALDELGVNEGEEGILRVDEQGSLNATTKVTIDEIGNLTADGLYIKNSSGVTTGFLAPPLSDGAKYMLPEVGGFPTEVLAVAGPEVDGIYPTFWMPLPNTVRRPNPFNPILPPIPIWIPNPEPTTIPLPADAPKSGNSIPALSGDGSQISDTPTKIDPSTGDISTEGSFSTGSSTSAGSFESIGSVGSSGAGATGGTGGIASTIGGTGGAAGASGIGGIGGTGGATTIGGGLGGGAIGAGIAGGIGGGITIIAGTGGTGGSDTSPATGGAGASVSVGGGSGDGSTGGAVTVESSEDGLGGSVVVEGNGPENNINISGGDDTEGSGIEISNDNGDVIIGGSAGDGNIAAEGSVVASGIGISDDDGSNQIIIETPDDMGDSYSVILPPTQGTEGQVLSQGPDNQWVWINAGGGVQSIGLQSNSNAVATISSSTTNPIDDEGEFTINFSSRMQELSDMTNYDFSGIPYYNFNELTEGISLGYYRMALNGSDGIIIEKTLDEDIDRLGYINIKAEPVNLKGTITGNGNLGNDIDTSLSPNFELSGPDQVMTFDCEDSGPRSGHFHLNNLYGSRVFNVGDEGELEFSLHAYGDGPSTDFDYAGYTQKTTFDLSNAGAPKTKKLELTYKDINYNSQKVFTHNVLNDSLSIHSQLIIPFGKPIDRPTFPLLGSLWLNVATDNLEYFNDSWKSTTRTIDASAPLEANSTGNNTTLAVQTNPVFSGDGKFNGDLYLKIPVGTLSRRYAIDIPEKGMVRYNTTLDKVEYYFDNNEWYDVWDSGGICNVNVDTINYNWKINSTVSNIIHNLENANGQEVVETVVADQGTANARSTSIIKSVGYGFIANNRYAIEFINSHSTASVPFEIFYDADNDYELTTRLDSRVDVLDHNIVNLKDPVSPQDAATKAYVDNNSSGGSSVQILQGKISSYYLGDLDIGDHLKFDEILFSYGDQINLNTTSPYVKDDNSTQSIGRISLAVGRVYKLSAGFGLIKGNNASARWYSVGGFGAQGIGNEAIFDYDSGNSGLAVAYVDLTGGGLFPATLYELRLTSTIDNLDDVDKGPWFTVEAL